MKIWTAVFASLILLTSAVCAHSQISLTSVLVSGQADTSGDQTFPSDSDSYSVNTLTPGEFAEAETGAMLNIGIATSSAGATFDGSVLSLDTFVTALDGGGSFFADASALVEVEFEVVGSYDVQFSSNAAGTNLDGSFFDNEFGENVFLLTDDNSVITSDSFTGRIGPGNYLIRTSSSASAGTPFFEGQSNTIVVASFTAVPEPSSLAVLGMIGIAVASRRRRNHCRQLQSN